jgi:hypothetical protein
MYLLPSGIQIPPPNPSGLCFCGCGQKAPIATQSNFVLGILKDHAMRFVHNHHTRKYVRYLIEDRGYKTPCWIWQLALSDDGYGQVSIDGRNLQAHRFYYEQRFSPIPDGLLLDHLCRVRCCVNPDHVEPVTTLENTRRGLNCKLSPDDLPVVRALRTEGLSYRQIGLRFGLTPGDIYLIIKGKNWRGL